MLRAKIDLRQPIFLLKFTEDRDRFKVQETPGSRGFRWSFDRAFEKQQADRPTGRNSQTQPAAWPTGRTAPPAAWTKPLNDPCGRGALLAVRASEAPQRPLRSRSASSGASHRLPRTCRVNYGCCSYKVRAPNYTGRGGRHSESAQSVLLQCSAKLCS
jgi:hypothetical protein